MKETFSRDLESFLSGNSKAWFSGYSSHSHDKSAFLSGFHHVKYAFLSVFVMAPKNFISNQNPDKKAYFT